MNNFFLSIISLCLLIGITKCLPTSKPHTLFTKGFKDENLLASNPVAKYFDQMVDHIGKKGGTFKQLYYESLNEGEDNVLKFLLLGGENALSTGSVSLNFMSQIADAFLADKYALEHRYYGNSQPFRNVTTHSLRFLTIEQSLEDIKAFIEFINGQTPNVHNKWIVFGGSYAGNLAVWVRMQFPDLIYGAVASSAPVQAQLNFKEYLENVATIMKKTDPECENIVKSAMNKLIHSFNNEEGKSQLKKDFRMCQDPKNQFDKFSLTSFIKEIFSNSVEYNIMTNDGNRLALVCDNLKSRNGDNLERLASLVADHYSMKNDCFNYNYNSNKALFRTEINEYNFERQWYYQMCTELGYFQTTGLTDQPFAHSLPLLYYTKLCKDAFGESFSEKTIEAGVEKTNEKFKGKSVENISNIIMIHGSSDPWNSLGAFTFSTDTSKSIVIQDGWHCQDMMLPLANDSKEIKKAREEISNILEQWCSV